MKVLITGAAGFIGFHLSKRFLQNGNYVHGIDNLNNYYSVELKLQRLRELDNFKNFFFEKLDLANIEKIKIKDFDLVINLAAQPGVRLPVKENYKYINSNILGFEMLLEFCLNEGINKIIYASSSSVYSGLSNKILRESDSLCHPSSFYAASKIMNENMASLYCNQHGLDAIGLRFFTVYGDNGRPDMAYFDFSRKILTNKKIILFNDGKPSRDMTHVSDIVLGIEKASDLILTSKSNNEIFNLGNNHPVSALELVELLEKFLKKKAQVSFKEKTNEVILTHADIKKARKVLGYNPSINIYEGLESFIDWFKKN